MSKQRAPRVGTTGILYKLAIMDLDSRVMPHTGHQVEVTQPYGCPRNGTFGHMYVNCLTCSEGERVFFLGLVCIGSFFRPNEPVQVLGPAANSKYHVRCADGSERVTAKVPDYLIPSN